MSGAEINAKLAALRERAAQQPISYKMLFDEAMETADDLFHRIGALEAALREIDKHLADFGYGESMKARKMIAAALGEA